MNVEAGCGRCAFARSHWKGVVDDARDQLHLDAIDLLKHELALEHANGHPDLPVQAYYDFLRTR